MESYLIHFFMHYVFLTHQYFMASLRPLLQFQFIRFLNVIYSLIYFCHCWIFIAALRFSLVASSGSYSPVVLRGLLIVMAFLVAEHRLEGCGFQQLQLIGSVALWHVKFSQIRESRLSTTGLPGTSF